MSTEHQCPECAQPLVRLGSQWQCTSCHRLWNDRPLCPACGSELEVLKACGAVDYFCPQCKAMQSKREVMHQLQPA